MPDEHGQIHPNTVLAYLFDPSTQIGNIGTVSVLTESDCRYALSEEVFKIGSL